MIELTVIGHIGKDCIVNDVNGKKVMNFNVAHSEKFKDANGTEINKTTWVECAYWSDKTGVAQYLKKGTQVYVKGLPEVRQYKKNDGSAGASMSLRVSKIELLGGKQEGSAQSNTSNNSQPGNSSNGVPDGPIDDLPF